MTTELPGTESQGQRLTLNNSANCSLNFALRFVQSLAVLTFAHFHDNVVMFSSCKVFHDDNYQHYCCILHPLTPKERLVFLATNKMFKNLYSAEKIICPNQIQ